MRVLDAMRARGLKPSATAFNAAVHACAAADQWTQALALMQATVTTKPPPYTRHGPSLPNTPPKKHSQAPPPTSLPSLTPPNRRSWAVAGENKAAEEACVDQPRVCTHRGPRWGLLLSTLLPAPQSPAGRRTTASTQKPTATLPRSRRSCRAAGASTSPASSEKPLSTIHTHTHTVNFHHQEPGAIHFPVFLIGSPLVLRYSSFILFFLSSFIEPPDCNAHHPRSGASLPPVGTEQYKFLRQIGTVGNGFKLSSL